MRKLSIILLTCVSFLIGGLVQADDLKAFADDINKSLPEMVDKGTRLDKVTSGEKSLDYRYTLMNLSSRKADKNKIAASLKRNIVKIGCSKLKSLLDRGIQVKYSYFSNDGRLLAEAGIKKSDC
ncbi:MAG TPA: hypothetical protein ENI65_04265 [Gammaproteobacteria bacterium]|nr:hypothetical protein [Gammaproteobacteria bacterium]